MDRNRAVEHDPLLRLGARHCCKLQVRPMNAIDEIKSRLQKYSQAQAEIEGNRVTVLPLDANGFAVLLVDNSPNYTVSFDAWHEKCENIEKALDAFTFSPSAYRRLKVGYCGNFARVRTVEEIDENGEWPSCGWIGLNETGLLTPPLFWLKKRYICKTNCLNVTEVASRSQ
jgi:hypothetical protein